MHRAFYRAREDAGAVVHLHSTMATAVACLPDVDAANPIPPLTPYFVMRVGRSMPIVEYYRPGDPAMEPAINAAAARCARGAAGQSWSGGVGQDADRCGLCGGGAGRGGEALSAAARHDAAAAERAAGGRSADDVRLRREGRPKAPRYPPGSTNGAGHGVTSVHGSEPLDGIESAAGAAAAAAFLRPPPFFRPLPSCARLSSQRPSSSLQSCGRPSSQRPSCGPRPSSSGRPCVRPSSARPCVRPSSPRPSCGRPPASPAPARVAARWSGFLRCSPVGTPSGVVGFCRAVSLRPR